MTSRNITRRKILELAEDLIQTRGFNAFSYQHLSEPLGIKNAAIHYHFPTKELLGLAIIKQTKERFQKWTQHPEHRVLPPQQQLHWFYQIYRYNLQRNQRICLIGALATDFQTLPTTMQHDLKKLATEVHKWFSQLLSHGRQIGVWQFQGRSEDKASAMIASLTGSLQLSRLLGEELYHDITDQLNKELNLPTDK